MKLLTSSKTMIEELKKLNITTSGDLINYLPYRYENLNYSNEEEINDKDKVVLMGRLVSNPRQINANGLNIITFHFVSKNNHFYLCKIFNRPFYLKMLDLENDFTIVATFNKTRKELNVISLRKGEIPISERLKPVYHLPNAIQNANYLNLVRKTLDQIYTFYNDVIPSYLINKYQLLNRQSALKKVHFPQKFSDINQGLRTLKFEECLEYCYKNRLIREQNRKINKVIEKEIDTKLINQFILNLDYKLTKDQVQSIKEIVLDMKSSKVMYRLLQGDVGTGKTLVAIISLYASYLRNKQAVLLAPTDSLARQHYQNVKKELDKYQIKTCLLIGDMKVKDKNQIKEDIKNNKYDVIVGTHAVFSKDVEYASLGLAIIDEQHRFGVNQRNTLANKGDDVDLLLMSATPIPRTLALSIYGDLDVSSLKEYPNKKRHVITKVVDYHSEKIEALIDYCLENNRQVFIVCPKIFMSGSSKSIEEVYQSFVCKYQDKIALLHGKMNNNEKVEILDKFHENQIKILVSTTIIELGIDVKNAGGIIIYSSNSFGLSSLHQLRGRVGRDGQNGYCLLVDDLENQEALERLKFLETCSDGFEISEEDMRRRGPGDFIGIEQSGFPDFSSLNIVNDFKMFEIARDEVNYIYLHQEDLENKKYHQYCLNKIKSDEVVLLID